MGTNEPAPLIENDHNFVFFDCKVSSQQHFESEKLRKPTLLPTHESQTFHIL